MNFEKKVIGTLNKCYSMTELDRNGEKQFLVAAEKQDPCYLFNEDGEKLETVWDGPGGTMTMLQVPGLDGAFLATHKFYSPNDSKEAKIVIAEPKADGEWGIRTLVDAPFVHRFGILERDGINYLIICCLKSDYEYRDDWRFPGAVFAAELPKDLSSYHDGNQLEIVKIKDGLLKNHGYSKVAIDGVERGVVGTENGTFLFTPPAEKGGEWEIELLSAVPSSDSVLIDFDGDGKLELGMIAPFHGNSISIFHLDDEGNYVPQWAYEKPQKQTEMVHATWAGDLLGKPTWVVGWRKGDRGTIAIQWDEEKGTYTTEQIDENAGAANVMHLTHSNGEESLVITNREIDEIAMYKVTE